MGYLAPPHARKPEVFPHIIRVSHVKASHEGQAVISRQKRNIFYQSGLQLCGEETAEQVVANHLSYFHLRGKTRAAGSEVISNKNVLQCHNADEFCIVTLVNIRP